jgi:two-component system, chemotaxis family, CheB/CheR fusion protein
MDAIPLHRRPAAVGAMRRSIVAIMEPHAEEVGVKMRMVLDAGLPAAVAMDEDKIAWVVGTLIGNALRYAPHGSSHHPRGTITVHASSKPATGEIAIEVTDDGPGIPSDRLPLLFQPAPYQRRVGYALILAREIAVAHGGTLEVESSQDPATHGTTVRLVLPDH